MMRLLVQLTKLLGRVDGKWGEKENMLYFGEVGPSAFQTCLMHRKGEERYDAQEGWGE